MVVYKGKSYDKSYIELCERVLEQGIKDTNPRPKYKDGTKAHSYGVFQHDIVIKPDEIPVLFSKKLYFRMAVEEILWIWQQKSNVVKDLEDKNIFIWSDWKKKDDGTIGKAYGYRLAQLVDDTGRDQVDNLIYNLKHDPESRRHITTLWDIKEGHEMVLKPCVYETQWVVLGGKLNLKVLIRSNDIALGNPFNIIQYWLLHKLICNEVNLEPGDIVFSISIPHIYDRHIEGIRNQIERFYKLNKIDNVDNKEVTVKLNIENKSFYDFKWDDIEIEGYDSFGGEPLKIYTFENAI